MVFHRNFFCNYLFTVCTAVADIVIILDQSTSIVSVDGGFDNWVNLLEAVVQVISSFQISPSLTRIALVRFSSRA